MCSVANRTINDCIQSGKCPMNFYQLDWKGRKRQPILKHQQLMQEAIKLLPPFPQARFKGRGIVTCAGGKFFDGAYVQFRALRHLGYDGPIECWHLKGEIHEWHREALNGLNVSLVDATEMLRKQPAVITHGWTLKPYAIVNSSFDEVLYLDSDVIPLRSDFLSLFDSPEFAAHGAIYFPDRPGRSITDLKPHQWEAMGLKAGGISGIESGEIYVSKSRCWKELNLALWQCEHWRFYFGVYHGDTGSWHFAHKLLGTDYAMPSKEWVWIKEGRIGPAMIQHDFAGEPLFAHYTVAKFMLDEVVGMGHFSTGQVADKRCSLIPLNDFCWNALEDLRALRSNHVSVLQIAANGDILTLLPALKYLSKDHVVTLTTGTRYAPLVEGLSWLKVIEFDGLDSSWKEAAKLAAGGGEVRIAQVGHIELERQQPNWSLEVWQRTGVPVHLFHQLPLEIENRDYDAEQALIDRWVEGDRPLVLINTLGNSSPYTYGDRLRSFLMKRYGKHFQILDLAYVTAKRFIDLCGLYERAVALISTDTGTLHLSYFNLLPTIALVRDRSTENGWGSSESRPHWVEVMDYTESSLPEGLTRIGTALENICHMPWMPPLDEKPPSDPNAFVPRIMTVEPLVEVSATAPKAQSRGRCGACQRKRSA